MFTLCTFKVSIASCISLVLHLTRECKKLSIVDVGLSLDKLRRTSPTNQMISCECAAKLTTGQSFESLLFDEKFRCSRSANVISMAGSVDSPTLRRLIS